MPLLDEIRASKLIELAHARFDPKLNQAELTVLHDSATSHEMSSLTLAVLENAPRPEIRAEFVRWLASDPEAAQHIDPKGIRVVAATIAGKLDLEGCHVESILDFKYCSFQGELNLISAETRAIYIQGSSLSRGVTADGVTVRGQLFLRQTQSEGEIHLLGASISGDISCNGAKLNANGIALSADNARIGGSVSLREAAQAYLRYPNGEEIPTLSSRFESAGQIRFVAAEIAGELVCTGAKLNATGFALTVDGSKIGGTVALDGGFDCEGFISLAGAEIGGNLLCSGAVRCSPQCVGARIGGNVIWLDIKNPSISSLDLEAASAHGLRDERESWPVEGHLRVKGFVYQNLELQRRPTERSDYEPVKPSAADRIDWLQLQDKDDIAVGQPWEQLASFFKASGDPEAAKEVLYAYERHSRGRNPLWRGTTYPWDQIVQWPWKIPIPIALLWLLGWLVFWRAHRMRLMSPTNQEALKAFTKNGSAPETYPMFHPCIYALENVLPVVRLGQDGAWQPNAASTGAGWRPFRSLLACSGSWAKRWAGTRWILRLTRARRRSLAAATRWRFRLTYRGVTAVRWSMIILGWFLAIILVGAISGLFKP